MTRLACYISSCHLDCRDHWSDCLSWASDAGFSGIELFQHDHGKQFEDFSPAECRLLARQAEQLGLTLAVHPWFDWTKTDKAQLAKDYLHLIELCAESGARYLNMHMTFLSDRQQGMERLFRATDPCIPFLQDAGITLLYENVPEYGIRDLGSEARDFETLFLHYGKNVPVRMNIDTGHAHIMHNLQPLAEDYADRWAYTHINDNMGLKDSHLAPSQGTLSFEKVAALAANASYTGPLLMEYNQRGLSAGMPELNRCYGAEGYSLDPIRLDASTQPV